MTLTKKKKKKDIKKQKKFFISWEGEINFNSSLGVVNCLKMPYSIFHGADSFQASHVPLPSFPTPGKADKKVPGFLPQCS